uniref:Reverse transcriptase domain-containing protein n=1 Tax=Panagrellus redivivus TaxID=6233 RepID=A0A7E4ZSG0_PANRE
MSADGHFDVGTLLITNWQRRLPSGDLPMTMPTRPDDADDETDAHYGCGTTRREVCAEIAPATGSEPTFGEPLRDEVDVGGKTVTALLDTGAATTVIRMDILIEILKNNTAAKGITRLTRQEAGLAAVNGDALNVKGWILMELRAKGANKTKAVVAIIEHMNHEMVIGMNILRYERQWWYRLQSLWKKAYKSKRPALFDATVDQTITVFGETSATMAIRTPIVHTLALIDSRVEQIESGIIKSRNGRAFVQVNNKDTKEITFRVGDTIGEVWPAEIVKDVAELDNADVIAGVESWDDTARRAELKARLNIQKSELSENLKAELEKKILDEYASVFAVYENEHGRTDLVTHTIDTHESAPIKIPNRPVPIPLKEKVWTAIKELIEAEVVEESLSPWSSPVVLAKKKDGELRICVDYRRLNSVTKKDAYPLPSQDSMMFQLKGMKIFSTMDFYSGYYQIPLDSESREKTAFSVLGRLYQFTVLPMGLTTSPACFLRLMEKVLGDLVGSSLFVYMDDILVYSTSEEEHVQVLEEVFRRLKDAGLRLKPSKCAFGRKQVAFLGHLITEEGIKIDADRVAAIQAIPQPKSVTEVRSFLGMAAYVRQFISNFSKRAAPLA